MQEYQVEKESFILNEHRNKGDEVALTDDDAKYLLLAGIVTAKKEKPKAKSTKKTSKEEEGKD